MRFCLVVLIGVWLTACSNAPDSYAPPVQRRPYGVSATGGIGAFVSMNDPNAAEYFVQDVSPHLEADSWRWTGQNPELRFFVEEADNRTLRADFGIAEATFKTTGPVTLTFLINGARFDEVRYDKPGSYEYSKPVPASILHAGQINTVRISIDKVWVSPSDKTILGIVMTRVGFAE